MHAMIDLETLGTGVDAAVLSIGVCYFDDAGLVDRPDYSARFNLHEQLRDRRVDAGTIQWWMKQSDQARYALFDEAIPCYLVSTIHADLIREFATVDYAWSQGSNFDITILDHMFRQNGFPSPWKYNAVRDTRTIYSAALDLIDDVPGWPEREGTFHHALDDARHQALCVIACRRYLKTLWCEAYETT